MTPHAVTQLQTHLYHHCLHFPSADAAAVAENNNNNVFIHIYLMAGICVSNESAAKNQKLLRNTKTYFSLHLSSSGSRSKESCICFRENLEWPQLKLWSLPQMNPAQLREALRLIVSHGSVFNWIQSERETVPCLALFGCKTKQGQPVGHACCMFWSDVALEQTR